MLWYVLPLAIAVALSIFPVLAVVLLLLSPDPMRSSTAYTVGWAAGVMLLVAVFAAGARLIPDGASEHVPAWVHYVAIVVGAFLVVEGAVASVRERRREGTGEAPRWLRAASALRPRRAFGFGLLMNARPKNLALTLAAGLAIGAAPITLLGAGALALVFALVGASTVIGLLLAYVFGKGRVRPLLTRLDAWLVSHAALVLKISIVLIGALMIVLGVSALASG